APSPQPEPLSCIPKTCQSGHESGTLSKLDGNHQKDFQVESSENISCPFQIWQCWLNLGHLLNKNSMFSLWKCFHNPPLLPHASFSCQLLALSIFHSPRKNKISKKIK
uniref:Uncharacterized protein n=1 Tax=Anas platyrhynchos platyrhynchos TaxID=8840 RepID=A0A493TUR9_ANAPP